jgi:hypothetical protein
MACHFKSKSEIVVVSCFNTVTCRPVAEQRLGKHVPAEAYCGIIGRKFLGNRAVNTPTNCCETVFSVGSAWRIYKGYRTE